MMDWLNNLQWSHLQSLLITIGIIIICFMTGALINKIVIKNFINYFKKKSWKWNEFFFLGIKRVLMPLSVIFGLFVSTLFWEASEKIINLTHKIIVALLIVIIGYFLNFFSKKAISSYGKSDNYHTPAATLTKNIISSMILILGFLVILNQFGISITPILTAVGVGGIAVALALQETLSNVVAGINITMAGEIKNGDYIKLDTNEEGYITDISWRETSLLMRENNVIRIPNSRLTKAILTHYNLPNRNLLVFLYMGVDYSSDLEHVEKVTLDVAKEIQAQTDGATKTFSPRVRFKEFGDSSINFRVVLGANSFEGQFLVQHEFIKKLHARYKQENITIPFPIRTVHIAKN